MKKDVEMVDINKKLFGQYPVKFPVNEDLVIIHGYNGAGKTKTLEALKEYFEEQAEKVIYFPSERFFNLTKDQIGAADFLYRIMNEKDIFTKFRLDVNDFDIERQHGRYIRSGMIQMMNFIATIILAEEPSVVLIDTPEISLDMHKKRDFINTIRPIDNVKKLIIVTHCPEIIASASDEHDYCEEHCLDIAKCVKLWRRKKMN